ncbi:MAG TPA: SDR family oxidoreductase [Candidatus Acidoferrum sp.]|nr:SDR family oxidoreductase [Candidatus Acidoferrum sp.]
MTAELRQRQVALVTGASAGIGLAIAQVLAEEGFDLVLVARRAPELEKLAHSLEVDYGTRVVVLAMDLLREGAGQELEEALAREGLAIEILVNNAGLMDVGDFREIELERHLRLIQLNVAVLTELTRRFLPAMVARGHGRILNVASLSAFQPVPSLAVYAAAKAFVLSLTESLSEELKGTGVSVTALCPGLVRTHMVEQAKEESALARHAPDFLVSDAAAVAREGVKACLAGRVIDVPGAPNRLTAHFVRFYPRWVVRSVLGLVARRAL